jgi:high affinity Mn2+ porin
VLDTRIGRRGQYVGEFEDRYELFSQPGKWRVTGWFSEAFTGSFSETLDDPYLNPLTAPADSPGIAATRRTRTEFGFVANLEQAITDDLGLFSRLSWRNGQTEIMSFTDIDRSASIGVQVKGTSWQRPDDKVGVAFAVNGLSNSYRAFLAAGGLGLDIGDGQLSYQTEKVLEAYYAYSLTTWATLSLDYQFIADPAYNADRGPVNIGSIRLHVEF